MKLKNKSKCHIELFDQPMNAKVQTKKELIKKFVDI